MPGFTFTEKHISKTSKTASYKGFYKAPDMTLLTCLSIEIENKLFYQLLDNQMYDNSDIIVEFSDNVNVETLITGLTLEVFREDPESIMFVGDLISEPNHPNESLMVTSDFISDPAIPNDSIMTLGDLI